MMTGLLPKIFVLFLISISLRAFAERNPEEQIFMVTNTISRATCTATLFKTARTCSLVTNAHCVREAHGSMTLLEQRHNLQEANVFRSDLSGPVTYPVRVIKAQSAHDLAELEIPAPIRKAYCDGGLLENAFPQSAQQLAPQNSENPWNLGLISMGIVCEKPIATYSGFSQVAASGSTVVDGWKSKMTQSQRTLEPTRIKEWPYAVKVLDQKIFHGMSGGAVVDNYSRLVGINVWVRDHDINQMFFIALADVMDFIQHAPNLVDVDLIPAIGRGNNQSESAGEGVGGNGHGDGSGGNGHGDGGGGGESCHDPREGVRLKGLGDLLMPNEGFIAGDHPNDVVLGINGESVDGADDYRYLAGQSGEHSIVKRDQKGYPDESIRKNIFSRIFQAGASFTSQPARSLEFSNTPETGRASLFRFDQPGSIYVDVGVFGEPVITARTLSANEIVLSLSDFFLNDPKSLWPVGNIEASEIHLSAELSADAQTLTLSIKDPRHKWNGEKMTCNNLNFLKLNCVGPTTVFSVHLYDVKNQKMELSFGSLIGDQSKGILHFYGDLKDYGH